MMSLIRRSGCSLKHLRLDVTTLSDSPSQIATFLSLCPDLEYLDLLIANVNDSCLSVFHLDPNSPDPPVPKLRILILHQTEPFEPITDSVSTLIQMIISRTRNLPDDSRFMRLQEVKLPSALYVMASYTHWAGEFLKQATGLGLSENEDGGSALRWARFLEEKFMPTWRRKSVRDHVNVKLHWEMDQVMKELEGLDLEPEPAYGVTLCVSPCCCSTSRIEPIFSCRDWASSTSCTALATASQDRYLGTGFINFGVEQEICAPNGGPWFCPDIKPLTIDGAMWRVEVLASNI